MMPAKTTITNILKRSNSFCDGTKYEAVGPQTYNKGEHTRTIHDSFSNDAIELVKCKNVAELNAPMGWCGGDFREEEILVVDQKVNAANGQVTFRDVSEEVRYKDTLIDELQKSNHELRLKFAEAENKVAQLRLKIEAHCECCSRGLGVEDYAEQKGYNDWSSVHSGMESSHQLNPLFWNSRDYNGMASDASPYLNKTYDDILNPYVKVKRWQDSMDPRNVKETDSSTGSTYAQKRSSRPLSPINVSARSAPIPRAESPCSRITNDYILLPLASGSNAPGVIHTLRHHEGTSRLDTNRFHPRKSFELGGNVKVESSEDPSARRLLKDTAKSTPDEWILRPGNCQRQSDSSLSTTHNSDGCRINPGHCDQREQLFMDQYNHSMRQSMHKSWVYHEHNPRFKRWGTQNEMTTGIVGGLMQASADHEKQQVPRESI